MNILQIATADQGGGAEVSASSLHASFRRQGHAAWLAVGRKTRAETDIFQIPRFDTRRASGRLNEWLSRHLERREGRFRGASRARQLHWFATDPRRLLARLRGREDIRFPGTAALLDMLPGRPDIIHCHNLHGAYFDVPSLQSLARQFPVILNLRDAWLLTGHCAAPFACERWKTGCGNCPDLTIPPAVWRDGTARNWRIKQLIYANSRLHVVANSQFTAGRLTSSMLGDLPRSVIHPGTDTDIFHPDERPAARRALAEPAHARLVLFAGINLTRNPFKDFATVRQALVELGQRASLPIVCLCLGSTGNPERHGACTIKHLGHLADRRQLANLYRAADLYLHGAKEESFGRTISEALACGTPVVATAVGGIPEQVFGLRLTELPDRLAPLNGHAASTATGILVPPGDAHGMAWATARLLDAPDTARRLGENAATLIRERFSHRQEIHRFLALYQHLIAEFHPWTTAP